MPVTPEFKVYQKWYKGKLSSQEAIDQIGQQNFDAYYADDFSDSDDPNWTPDPSYPNPNMADLVKKKERREKINNYGKNSNKKMIIGTTASIVLVGSIIYMASSSSNPKKRKRKS